MAGIDMGGFLELLGDQLQSSEVEDLKYILGNSFTGKVYSFLALQETFLEFFESFSLRNHFTDISTYKELHELHRKTLERTNAIGIYCILKYSFGYSHKILSQICITIIRN